jgi:hypothetical protein
MAKPQIFVSYRRDDTRWLAGRLYDRLQAEYGRDHVFRDVDTIRPGIKYTSQIESAVSECDVLIALIGDAWLSASDAKGRRLDNPNDLVRLEIAAALARDIPIIPVLVEGAQMPPVEEVPSSISGLSLFQASEVTDSRWSYDVDQLLAAINELTNLPTSGARAADRLVQKEPVASSVSKSSSAQHKRHGGGVYISHRRAESAPYATMLYSRLTERFGRGQVFMDLALFESDMTLAETVVAAVRSCSIVLVLIGPQWLTITDETGRRRIDDEGDFVRLEVEAALKNNIRMLPIILDEALVPRDDQLPPSLARLVRRNFMALSSERSNFGIDRVLEVVDRVLDVQ